MNKRPGLAAADALAGGGLALIACLSPLPFGSVQPWARLTLVALAGAVFLAALGRSRAGLGRPLPPGTGTILFWLGLGLFGGALQLIPLPGSVLAFLDPGAAGYYLSLGGGGGGPISLDPARTLQDLALAAAGAAVFLSLLIYRPGWTSRQRFLTGLLAGALTVGFLLSVGGIVQRCAAPERLLGIRGTGQGHPFGPFVNRNHFAGYVGMLIPIGLALLLSGPGKRTGSVLLRFLRRAGRDDPRPLLIAFMTAVMIAALGLSGSRGGIVSLGAGTAILLALAGRQRLLTRSSRLRLGAMLAALALVFAAWEGRPALERRFGSLGDAPTRLRLWGDTVRIAADFPFLGTGLGTFAEVFPSYRSFSARYGFTHAENDYLQAAAEAGLWGLICLLGAAGAWGRAVWRAAGRIAPSRPLELHPRFLISPSGFLIGAGAGAGTLLIHGLFNFNFHIPSNLMIFAILAAVAAGAGEETPGPEKPGTLRGRALLAGGNLALAALNRLLFRPPPRDPKSLLVFRTGNLGDSWCALPALGALERRFGPDRITIATAAAAGGLPHSAQIFAEIGGFRKFLIYRPQELKRWRGAREWRRRIRGGDFDLVVYLSQSSAPWGRILRDMLFFRAAGIRRGTGFRWNKPVWGGRSLPLPGPLPDEAARLMELLAPLGIPPRDIRWPRADTADFLPPRRGPLICLHPSAKFASKQWPMEKMAETAERVGRKIPAAVFAVIGDETAADFARGLDRTLGKDRVIDLAGKTSYSRLYSVLAAADLLISPDSGPVHVAAAAGTPVVGIYSSRDLPGAWHPHGAGHIVLRRDPPCGGCLKTECPGAPCLEEISPAAAAAAALEILTRQAPDDPVPPPLL